MRRREGFTMVEMVIVAVLVGVLAALAVPALARWSAHQRVKEAARAVADAFHIARVSAIRTGDVFVAYFSAAGGTDACGNPLVDTNGRPVPILVLDDGQPGSATQNCCIDPGEQTTTFPSIRGVGWGVSRAQGPAPSDTGLGTPATGSTFAMPNGAQANGVLFRPDGMPVAFSGACVQGNVGSGGGAIYITNGVRDYAVVLSPLGGVRVHGFDVRSGAWAN